MKGLLRQLVVLVSLVSCSDDSAVSDGTLGPSAILLLTQPGDLTSNHGEAPVRVILQPWIHSYVTTALIQDVRSMISARAQGQELTLSVDVEIDNAVDSPEREAAPGNPTSLLVRPQEGAWPDAWVELRIGPLTEALKPNYQFVVDNYAIARFSTASRPVIRAVELCPKPDGTLRFLVHFSEPVGSAAAEGHVFVSQDGATCMVLGQGVDTPSLTYDCRGFALERDFSFSMLPGMRATSGLEVGVYGGGDTVRMSGIYDDLQSTQQGCRGATF